MSQDVRPGAPDPSLGPQGPDSARYRPVDPPVTAGSPDGQPATPAYGGRPGYGAPPGYAPPSTYGLPPRSETPPAGYGPPGPGGPVPPPGRTTDGMAVAALVCGIVAAPLGVILGIVSLGRIKRRNLGGRGLAIAGIVVGALFTLFTAAMLVLGIALAAGGVGGISSTTCVNSVCETTVAGAPYTIENIGDEDLGARLTVVAISDGSAQVQGDVDTVPTVVTTGETFTVDGQEVTLLSAGAGQAVFQYRR